MGATLFLAHHGSLDPDHIFYGILSGSSDTRQVRLRFRRPFVPAARSLLDNFARLGIRASEWTNQKWKIIVMEYYIKRLPARVKAKVYSSVVRPATVYGLETVAVTKKQAEEMEVAEMKMLRFAIGVTRKDKIRNEYIRSTLRVERLEMKMRESRLRWYGHVVRRDQEYVRRKMMEMELPGKRIRGRPKRIFVDLVKKDMGEFGAKETDVENRKAWRMMIRCSHP